jgi:hypothetical protein
MQRLAGFSLIAYDTNCLVYYCFLVDIPETNPKITITVRQTGQARAVTDYLVSHQQKVTTIQAAYEELNDCIYNAVEERMTDREVEAQLGYSQNEKVPDLRKLQVQQSVERKARKLENKGWFVLDREYAADASALARLQQFFNSQDPAKFGRSKKPNSIDMKLIDFSLLRQAPLVKNDRGISNFSNELKTAGLGFAIHNLMDLTVS